MKFTQHQLETAQTACKLFNLPINIIAPDAIGGEIITPKIPIDYLNSYLNPIGVKVFINPVDRVFCLYL